MPLRKILPYALRILLKYRLYTGISLMGMSIAVCSCWFIANYVHHATSYDAFQAASDRIYRVDMEVSTSGTTDQYATTGLPPGAFLKENYPGVEAYARMTIYGNATVNVGPELFEEDGYYVVNPGVLNVFSFQFIEGNPATCFNRPNSIVLSRSLATKYFPAQVALDQLVEVGETTYSVSGVVEDWPPNSHLGLQAMLYSGVDRADTEIQDWFNLEYYNYVKVTPQTNQLQLDQWLTEAVTNELQPALVGSGMDVRIFAEPLRELYFSTGLIDDVPKGNRFYIQALVFAGLLILLIAGVNYMNLSLTRSTRRSREISLKKILGITRRQLLFQSISESFLMSVLVMGGAAILVVLLDSYYFFYSGFHAFNIVDNILWLLGLFGLTLIFGLAGTSYSDIYLTYSRKIIFTGRSGISTFKRILLGIQFTIASVIIMATLVMNKQIHFMKTTDLGFSSDEIIVLHLPDGMNANHTPIALREELTNHSYIRGASLIGGGALPGEENGKEVFGVNVDGNKTERVFNLYRIDENYVDLLNITFSSGRNFQADRKSDRSETVLINESLARSLHWKQPVGKIIWCWDEPREVIGVIKDFHNKSLHDLIEPIIFVYDESLASNLLMKTSPANLKKIKSVWKADFPGSPFSYFFFDEFLEAKYLKEDHLAGLLGVFSFIALGLSCMGMLALFSLQIHQQTREISIRKILGADTLHLLHTLTKNYLFIALAGIILAIPLAVYLMNSWLNSFSYQVNIGVSIFALSAMIILAGSAMAILFHVLKALNINPAETLKTE